MLVVSRDEPSLGLGDELLIGPREEPSAAIGEKSSSSSRGAPSTWEKSPMVHLIELLFHLIVVDW